MSAPWTRVERFGEAMLYLGDCLGVLPWLPLAGAAIVSDPPYGMDWDTDSRRFSGGAVKRGEGREWGGAIMGDREPFDPAPWLAWGEVILFGCNHFSDRLPAGGMLVWLKKAPRLYGSFLSDAEVAWRKGSEGVFCFYQQFPPPSRMAESGNGAVAHPTQKPIALMEWCIGMCKAAVIVDPYMGSGSTGVAAIKAGRRFVGVEAREDHFDTACRRIADAVSRPTFGGWA